MVSVTFVRRAYRRRWRGLNLFGVLMALSLVAAAVIGTVTIYNSARETQARNDAQQLLTQLVVAVHQIYQGESQYPDGESLIDELDVRGAIPGKARTTAGGGQDADGKAIPTSVGIENPFGGTVTGRGRRRPFHGRVHGPADRQLRGAAGSLRRADAGQRWALADRHRLRPPATGRCRKTT